MSQSSLVMLNLILAAMMFGIALSLTANDFKRVINQPRAPVTGLVAQLALLPLLSFILTLILPLSAEVELGILLVGSCPGGSFSNIMTYLARGNTALSVSMTAVSSIAATVVTPINFALYASLNPDTAALLTQIAMPLGNIFIIVGLVLGVPLASGLWVARRWPRFALQSQRYFRYVSLVILFSFVAIALISNWQAFVDGAGLFLAIVVVHNAMALGLGYVCARLVRCDHADTKAMTLEVGIQNSGLGLGIIFTFFADLQGMAIVAAGWGIWHLISGLALSRYWHYQQESL